MIAQTPPTIKLHTVSDSDEPAQDQSADFLDHFPLLQRGVIKNSFHHAIRVGERTPDGVVRWVERWFLARLDRGARFRDGVAQEKARAILDALASHPEEALALAEEVLAYEALPEEERRRLKEARGEEHRLAWMEQQEPTSKQVAYCRALGYRGVIESRRHASEIIDRLKASGGR